MCNDCPYKADSSFDNYVTLYTEKEWYNGIEAVHECHTAREHSDKEVPCKGSILWGRKLSGTINNQLKDLQELEIN